MVLVFIMLISIFIVILLVFSTIRIQVKNFEISNLHKNQKPRNYKIQISLYLFNVIKLIWINLDNNKIMKISQNQKWTKQDLRKFFDIKDLKLLSKLSPKLSFLNLKIKFGTVDILATTYFVAILSSLIAILLPYVVKEKEDKYYYEILPIYSNKNLYEIKFNCIIEEKMVHIISIVYALLKRRRDDKNERTSNRRSYAYSHE